MKTSLNFSNINSDALDMINRCLEAVMNLAADENAMKEATAAARNSGKSGDDLKNATSKERAALKASRAKANNLTAAFFSRYISTEDYLSGNGFSFKVEPFLRNIGVLSGDLDNAKKSTVKKVEGFQSLVVGRTLTRRAKGASTLSTKEYKDTSVETFLAVMSGLEASGCFVYGKEGLEKVDFAEA